MDIETRNEIVKVYNLLNKDLKNINKISMVLSFWLEIFSSCIENEISLKENTLSILTELENEEGIIQERKLNSSVNIFNRFKRHILRYLRFFPLKKGILISGYSKKIDFLKRIITEQKLMKIDLIFDEQKKEVFFKDLKFLENHKDFLKFKKSLPNVFFSKPIKPINFPSKLSGSPVSFLKEDIFKVLFLDKEIYFIGIQHGGGFGELNSFKIEDFEISFSDKYYFWGLGPKNITQNRFKIKKIENRKIEEICFLGTTKLSKTYSKIIDIEKIEYEEVLERRNKISKSLDFLSAKFMVSPKNKNRNHGVPQNIKEDNMFLQSEVNEKYLENKLFIIDWIGHTFFYQAIYGSIPFIIIFKRSWLDKLSDNFLEVIKILRSKNILYFTDEEEAFQMRIYDLYDKKKYNSEVFSTLRKYLSNKIV